MHGGSDRIQFLHNTRYAIGFGLLGELFCYVLEGFEHAIDRISGGCGKELLTTLFMNLAEALVIVAVEVGTDAIDNHGQGHVFEVGSLS